MNRVLAIGGVVVLVQTFVLVVHFEYSGHFHASRAATRLFMCALSVRVEACRGLMCLPPRRHKSLHTLNTRVF